MGRRLISRGLTFRSRRFGLCPEDNGEPMRVFSRFTFWKDNPCCRGVLRDDELSKANQIPYIRILGTFVNMYCKFMRKIECPLHVPNLCDRKNADSMFTAHHLLTSPETAGFTGQSGKCCPRENR